MGDRLLGVIACQGALLAVFGIRVAFRFLTRLLLGHILRSSS
jgi:hypothetical protein